MPNEIPHSSDIEKNKELAALSYLWIFSVILLAARRDSPFIKWHARQGVVLFFISIGFWLIPFLYYGELLILAFMILGFIQAAQGQLYRLPVIGSIAEGKFDFAELTKVGHLIKHAIIHFFKPEHVTPAFPEAPLPLKSNDESALAALSRRVEEDEKKIKTLEEEVHTLTRPS